MAKNKRKEVLSVVYHKNGEYKVLGLNDMLAQKDTLAEQGWEAVKTLDLNEFTELHINRNSIILKRILEF